MELINNHCVFSGLSESEIIRVVAESEQIICKKNDFLIQEGDTDKQCYLIINGELEVIKFDSDNTPHRLALLSRGDVAGGIVMLDDKSRSASVRCLSDCKLLVLNQSNLVKLIAEDQHYYRVFKNIATMICNQFRETNEVTIQALKDKITFYKTQVSMGRLMVGVWGISIIGLI